MYTAQAIHFTRSGQCCMGARFANAYIQAIMHSTLAGQSAGAQTSTTKAPPPPAQVSVSSAGMWRDKCRGL
jgi:hypothetical protein